MSSYNIPLLMLGIDLFLDSNTQLCCDKRVYKCPDGCETRSKRRARSVSRTVVSCWAAVSPCHHPFCLAIYN